MAKFPINTFLLLSRRSFTVATESGGVKTTASSVVKKVEESSRLEKEGLGRGNEIFWMRDPKTGYWIPESHFDEIDVVELRNKFLPKKSNS